MVERRYCGKDRGSWNCGRNNYEKDEIMYNEYSGIIERREFWELPEI